VSASEWVLAGVAVTLLVYGAFIAALVAAGRREDARALAGFVPDCVVLFRRLLADARVPRSRKLVLWGLIAYLALPIDVVPDFIPVAGQLDDVLAVALVLRILLRGGRELVAELWPGPRASLDVILRLAY
jgi:uncharacterized membrane protein YkvA (DUF1232 family)